MDADDDAYRTEEQKEWAEDCYGLTRALDLFGGGGQAAGQHGVV
jgi:hypothetical protein